MDKTQYQNLIEEVRALRDEVARIDRDLGIDRHDLEDFRIQMDEMKSEIRELRGALSTNADRVQDKVNDVLKPAVKQVNDLQKTIDKKKTLIITHTFWEWFKSKFKTGGEINEKNRL